MNNQTALNTTLHTNLISLSEAASGFSASEVTGHSPEQVRRAAEALVRAGRVVRAAVSPRRIRYFANERLAKACIAGRIQQAGTYKGASSRSKAPWSADEPAIITSRTKIFKAPPLPRNVFRTNTFSQF